MLAARIASFIAEHALLTPGQPVLVGFSGGADSLCLVDILRELGYPVVAAHFDHHLRPEAADDARRALAAAAALGVPATSGEGDVRAYARAHGHSLEEAARILRYRFLFAQAEASAAQAVAVGHTAGDQAETVLMHFLRGSGLAGLRGMLPLTRLAVWSPRLPLVRPLLAVTRAETEAYCAARGLAPLEDASNRDPQFYRNRLRHALLPALETYQPQVKAALARMAAVLAAEEEVLLAAQAEAWQACLKTAGPGYLALRGGIFRALPRAVQRRVARQAAFTLLPTARDLGFEATERMVAVLRGERQGWRTEIEGGLRLVTEGADTWLTRDEQTLPTHLWPQVEPGTPPVGLPVPGRVTLQAGWQLLADRVPAGGAAPREGSANPFRVTVSVGAGTHLGVRTRLPGERFQPLGLGGHSVKLSDFMIDEKMPRRLRAGWPLVVVGEQVVWVPGYRLGHAFGGKGEVVLEVQPPGQGVVS